MRSIDSRDATALGLALAFYAILHLAPVLREMLKLVVPYLIYCVIFIAASNPWTVCIMLAAVQYLEIIQVLIVRFDYWLGVLRVAFAIADEIDPGAVQGPGTEAIVFVGVAVLSIAFPFIQILAARSTVRELGIRKRLGL